LKAADAKAQLARGVAALEAAPSDLGVWLDLGAALAAAGKRDEAVDVMTALGDAASELGQVALAVACARWLAEQKATKPAEALVGRIARTHCADSERIDRSSRPRPPLPPISSGERRAVAPTSFDEAVARAGKAVAAAAAAARARAGTKLPPTPLLSGLAAPDVERLIGVARLVRHPAGHVVLDVGQPAASLYWLARGAATAARDGEALGELRSGAFFGEIALVAGTTRTARVECTEPSWLLDIPAASLEQLAAKAPRLATVLAEYARSRLLANVMRTSALFQRLDDAERRVLLGRFESRLVAEGGLIVRQGEDNERLHVVVSGRCEVRDGGDVVATLGVGDGFGESSLLRRAPAAADVVALEPTVTLSLSRASFDDIAVKHPELLAEVYKLLVERERQNQAITHDATDLII
jgi:CRP-like cAMP-binding protein